ncbi:MAG: YjbQ family protein [FCB group bacterium]|nr:YjbQ family protein [FCB group bacterium]
MKNSFHVTTSGQCQFIDITAEVQKTVTAAGLDEGIVIVFVPHTTAGITINENADPDVQRDIIMHCDKLIPQSSDFRHGEGNSPAHIKASFMGSSVTIIVSDGKLNLGTWQGIYFCEFDGPRTRKVRIKIIEG